MFGPDIHRTAPMLHDLPSLSQIASTRYGISGTGIVQQSCNIRGKSIRA